MLIDCIDKVADITTSVNMLLSQLNSKVDNQFKFFCSVKNYSQVKKNLYKKTGVYLFIDKDGNPVYIGVGGKSTERGLVSRITQELKKHGTGGQGYDTGATLSKNIKEIEQIDENEAEKIIKNLNLTILIVGSNSNLRNRRIAQVIERMLIAACNPKYNLD